MIMTSRIHPRYMIGLSVAGNGGNMHDFFPFRLDAEVASGQEARKHRLPRDHVKGKRPTGTIVRPGKNE